MTRRQRKSPPSRRIGPPVLICIDFDDFIRSYSPHLMIILKAILRTKECFIRYPNTSKKVWRNWSAPRFSTHFSLFGYPDETFLVFAILLTILYYNLLSILNSLYYLLYYNLLTILLTILQSMDVTGKENTFFRVSRDKILDISWSIFGFSPRCHLECGKDPGD